MKDNPAKPLSRILARDAQIGAWHERMQRESRLTTAVRRYVPRALAERVRVAEVAPPKLVLAVPAGAVAAVIRQRLPDILAGLRREGIDFTEIAVRVQVAGSPAIPTKALRNQPAKLDSRALRMLAEGLPAGPLRDAVARLARKT
jgi:hypothetical protein